MHSVQNSGQNCVIEETFVYPGRKRHVIGSTVRQSHPHGKQSSGHVLGDEERPRDCDLDRTRLRVSYTRPAGRRFGERERELARRLDREEVEEEDAEPGGRGERSRVCDTAGSAKRTRPPSSASSSAPLSSSPSRGASTSLPRSYASSTG